MKLTYIALATSLALTTMACSEKSANSKKSMAVTLIPVSAENFAQAETALNFANWAKLGSDKEIFHYREVSPVGSSAPTIRMNWDTNYSARIVKVSDDHTFDIYMPETKLYVSAHVVDENGYAPHFLVEKGKTHTVSVDTDYAWVLFRTELRDRKSQESLAEAHKVQDGLRVSGMMADSTYTMPNFDQDQLAVMRDAYKEEFLDSGIDFTYAKKAGQVDQHSLDLSHAAGWGGMAPELNKSNAYSSSKTMSGTECRAVSFDDPKNKFFTSFTLYDTEGYLMAGETHISSHTWKINDDDTIALHFNCDDSMTNNLSSDGQDFNYVIRNYGASQTVLDGDFKPVVPTAVK